MILHWGWSYKKMKARAPLHGRGNRPAKGQLVGRVAVAVRLHRVEVAFLHELVEGRKDAGVHKLLLAAGESEEGSHVVVARLGTHGETAVGVDRNVLSVEGRWQIIGDVALGTFAFRNALLREIHHVETSLARSRHFR